MGQLRIDPEHIRKQYQSLSDEAFLAVNRSDLVEVAQQCYDAELSQRKLRPLTESDDQPVEKVDAWDEPRNEGDKPGWLAEAAAVYSYHNHPASEAASNMAAARDALEAAGIPCYLELAEIPEAKNVSPQAREEWRLLVPGSLNLRAASVLERDIFNQEFEAEWKTHLTTLSDTDLLKMHPKAVFCGLFDKAERVTRAYADEIARRRLKPNV